MVFDKTGSAIRRYVDKDSGLADANRSVRAVDVQKSNRVSVVVLGRDRNLDAIGK